jgi:TPR repeat protein
LPSLRGRTLPVRSSLPVVQTSEAAHINAAVNYTNGHTNQAFNDYTLATQLNPKDGEAYYRLAVMHYRGIGCGQMTKKERYRKAVEYANKAEEYGNLQIKRKAKNFLEYIGG